MKEKRYTISEISMATGIKAANIAAARYKRNIPGNREGYTLEEVKLMLERRNNRKDKQRAEELKSLLKRENLI